MELEIEEVLNEEFKQLDNYLFPIIDNYTGFYECKLKIPQEKALQIIQKLFNYLQLRGLGLNNTHIITIKIDSSFEEVSIEIWKITK